MTTSFPITPHGMAVDSAMSPAKPANPSGPRLLEILAENFPLHPEDSDQPLSDRYFEQIMGSGWGDVKNDGIDNWMHAHIILPALGINLAKKAQLQPKLARLTEHVGTSNAFFLLVKGYQLALQSQALAKTTDHFAEHNLACTLFAELLQDFILEHRTAYHALDLTRLKFEHTAPEIVLFQQQLEQANCNILKEFPEDAQNAYQLIWASLTEYNPSTRARLETYAKNNQYVSYCLGFLQELEKESPEDVQTIESQEYEFCNWLLEQNDQKADELLSLIAFLESPAHTDLTILLCCHLIEMVKHYQDAMQRADGLPEWESLKAAAEKWLNVLTFKLDSLPESSATSYLYALLHQVLDDHKKASEYLQNALVLQHSDNMFENSGQFLQQIGSLYLELAESDEEMNSELTKMGAYCLLRAAWKLEPEAREELQQLSQKEPQHQLLQLYLALLQDHLPADDSSDQALIKKLQSHCTTHYDAVHTTLELMRDKENIQETNQALAELLKNTSTSSSQLYTQTT